MLPDILSTESTNSLGFDLIETNIIEEIRREAGKVAKLQLLLTVTISYIK